MLTGELRGQIDKIWDAFWAGGIANPIEVIEQITYLLFIKRLDDLQTLEENKARTTKKPIERRIFPEGRDDHPRSPRPYDDYRWSRFKHFDAGTMYEVVAEHVFPFLRTLGGSESTYATHMKDARFTIPKEKASLLVKAVDLIDNVPMQDRDTKGDLYEYMLGKIASAGQNGQFRTPRHVIQLMVEMTAPTPTDVVCDPACGTAGFLVAVGEYLRTHHPEALTDTKLKRHFHTGLFNGFDFDSTMLRIGSMNMLLHGVENPNIRYRDSLSKDGGTEEEAYTLVLANPPFAGSLDYENCAPELQRVVKTKKTELLFLALFLRLLKPGGRAAVIVPAGVLESDSTAHTSVRKALIDNNRLEGVIALPHWVFKPYASVATAILLFSRSGQTDRVWFYRIENDGFDDDALKTPCEGSELPEVLDLWQRRQKSGYSPRKSKHRFVTREEIVRNDYDLCERVYLSGYDYPSDVPLRPLGELFTITKGTVGAAQAEAGPFTFITSAEEPRRHKTWSFEGEAICVPLVSATGHGHAAIKQVHYVSGKFAAATIAAVMLRKSDVTFHVPYVYYYLLAHKDELLVPLMRGAANVSLSLERLGRLRIPLPADVEVQKAMVRDLEQAAEERAKARLELAKVEESFASRFARFRESL